MQQNLMITETQQFKLTRLNELVGSCLTPFDIVEVYVAQLLLAAQDLHFLARGRVRTQNVATTSDGQALAACDVLNPIKTSRTFESVIVLRSKARGSTWVSSHDRLLVAPHAVSHCTIRAFLVQLSDLLPQIGIERCLAYPPHDLLLTRKQNLIRRRILILRRVHDPFDLVDEVAEVLLYLLADRTRLCLAVALISKLRHLSLMESL